MWRFREGTTDLSPAPLYHAASLVSVASRRWGPDPRKTRYWP